MSSQSIDNTRIAKNTLFLYFRTFLVIVVSLYTSRVVLNTLGINDYGIYNAVGGIVTMFAIISGTLSNAISRYITYEIGKTDKDKINKIFCTSVNILLIISFIIFLFCEVIGIWFLNIKMNIPPDRLHAANYVLHCSLLMFIVNLLSVPYNACIIAYERMNAYAYISIFDVLLKLIVAYLLIISPIDKLVSYSVLLLITSLVIRLSYTLYCNKNFEGNCRYRLVYDKKMFMDLMSFSGWNFFTNGASVLNSHGVTLLTNLFFGVIVNSARGIATQVESAIIQFANSFTTAVNPQIIKSYAIGDIERVYYLVCKGAKFSCLLLLFILIPFFFEADTILEIWLMTPPPNAALYTKLSLLGILMSVLGNSSYNACLATGNIKQYSIWVTFVGCFAFFLTWLAYYLGAPAETTYYIYAIIYALVQIVRLFVLRKLIKFPILLFFNEVIIKIIITTLFAILIPCTINYCFEPSIFRLFISFLLSFIWTCVCIYFLALTKNEKIVLKRKVLSVIQYH